MAVSTQTTRADALMRVVRAAIRLRQVNMDKCTGSSVYRLNELYQSVDALALVGAEAGLAELGDAT